jgi:hypothetical protein
MTYTNGLAPIVTVYGPGNLHHLTYGSTAGLHSGVGMIPTANTGETNFILGFSFDFAGYAFYWEGAGPAFWRITGNSTVREPVGTSWTNATGLPWGNEIILGLNVAAQAGNTGEMVTVYIIPNDLD